MSAECQDCGADLLADGRCPECDPRLYGATNIRLVQAVSVEDYKEALAAIDQGLDRIDQLQRKRSGARFCPECGPIEMDSDGHCAGCGRNVDGTFVRKMLGEQEVE